MSRHVRLGYPDGRAFNITDTMQRLRFRDGVDHETLMTPGKIYKIDIGQMVFASDFAPGHRIRIEIAGSNFPEYERNMNTGGDNFDETAPITAALRIYHDKDHPSEIVLPVVP